MADKAQAGHAADNRDSVVDARTLYIEQLRKEAAVFPKMPDVEVKFDFSYKLTLPNTAVNREIETVGKSFAGCFSSPYTLAKAIGRKASGAQDTTVTDLYVLKECKGVVHPGTMTLLLSTPGGGKTSFLKALAGRIPVKKLTGEIRYNGASQQDLATQGIKLRLLSNYVDQLDVHLPYLTVRETAEFACFNSTVAPEMMGHEMLVREAEHRVDRVLKLLSLTNCANTLVGNELVRGVSGGEKKRVTIAEALVSNSRLLCLDEISTGLDASVTFDICASIRVWAKEMKGTVIIALLQPTPEVYHQFDDAILLREGQVIFQGGKHIVHNYLKGFGFIPPKSTLHAMEDDDPDAEEGDVADWLTEVLASPAAVWQNQRRRRAASRGNLSSPNLSSPSLQEMDKLADGKKPPLTTSEFVASWRESKLFSERFDTPPSVPQLALESEFAQAQYGRQYPRKFSAHFLSILKRQTTITMRNSLFVSSRLISACVISAILGSVWFQLDDSAGFAKFGMLLFAALQVAFSNLSETPFAVEFKYVAYKQMAAGMYPPAAYVAAASAVHVPIAAIETAFFSVVLFFMVGLQPGEGRDTPGGRWAFFYLVLFLVDLCMGAIFRSFAYILPNMEAAQTAPGPVIALQVIFAGFLISPNHMGWLIFMYFISIFGYTLKSIAQNEFASPIYTSLVPDKPEQISKAFAAIYNITATKNITLPFVLSQATSPVLCNTSFVKSMNYTEPISCVQYGYFLMKYLAISANPGWKWGGVGFLIGFALLTNVLSTIGLSTVHIERNVGTSRAEESGEEKEEKDEVVWIENAAAAASVMPFDPMTIVWRDIEYTVTLNKNLGGGTKLLLQKLWGVAVPGKLMALMGASGAGKTTLLDVIAGRKSSGVMKGEILLNGFPKEAKSFARLTAYCEQMDVHNSFSTVQESLKFSAALRLPPSVSDEQRSAFVNEVMDLLELRSIASRKVGEIGSAEGLSPGQRKILTIAVEMVSNAPILFLDEPTSGLDSRAAQVVMREVRKIANTGRTVICTIHQPSKELFFKFDEMCLLQRGGWQAYMGPVGHRASDLIAYVEGVPGAHPCPPGMNPASWMLDVLAGTDSSGGNNRPKELARMDTRAVIEEAAAHGDAAANGAGEAAAAAAEAPATTMLSGPMLQETYQSSAAWSNLKQTIDHHSAPAPGAQPYKFDSVYARSTLYQLYQCSRRVQRSHWRNVGLNYTRITIIWGLMIMFGVIYYKISAANDAAGVQSIVSVVFMSCFFVAIINMNTNIPVLIRERAVFYRERFSNMYPPEVHALSFAIGEIPWLTLEICIVIPCLYFMLGFRADAASFFTYLLVNWIMSYLFVSLGQFGAAYYPTADVAQAVLGVFIPLFFLFGGLYLPYPQIPIWWKWAYWADPISYCIEALVPTQFMREGNCRVLPTGTQPLPNVTYCPYLLAQSTNGIQYIDRYEYVKETYGLKEEFRWPAVGYLAVFIGGLQCFHMLAVRFKSHINR